MSQVDYEIGGREAHCFGFGDEFLRVELYDGYFSIAWTTPLPIADVLERVQSLLQNVQGEAFVFDTRKRAHEKLKAIEAVQRLLAGDASLSFARLELPDMTLVWEQQDAPEQQDLQNRDELTKPSELALMSRVFDEGAFVRVLSETGTKHVARDARKLVGRVAYVADHVGRGQLRSTAGNASD